MRASGIHPRLRKPFFTIARKSNFSPRAQRVLHHGNAVLHREARAELIGEIAPLSRDSLENEIAAARRSEIEPGGSTRFTLARERDCPLCGQWGAAPAAHPRLAKPFFTIPRKRNFLS